MAIAAAIPELSEVKVNWNGLSTFTVAMLIAMTFTESHPLDEPDELSLTTPFVVGFVYVKI